MGSVYMYCITAERYIPVQFFVQSRYIRVDLLSYESKPTDKREKYNLMAGKNWAGNNEPGGKPTRNQSVDFTLENTLSTSTEEIELDTEKWGCFSVM